MIREDPVPRVTTELQHHAAEASYTAFSSRRKGEQVTARLVVRRVKRLNPMIMKSAPGRWPCCVAGPAATRSRAGLAGT